MSDVITIAPGVFQCAALVIFQFTNYIILMYYVQLADMCSNLCYDTKMIEIMIKEFFENLLK